MTICVPKGLCCNAQKEPERQTKGSCFISFCHSWKILNLCFAKPITAKRNHKYCYSAVHNVASCLIFMCVCLFCGFAGGITRRMVRAAPGTSTCVEFVGSEPAYDDSQFIPLPISKGKNNPQTSPLYSSRKTRELKLYFNNFNFHYILQLALAI